VDNCVVPIFDEPRFITNNFSVHIPRNTDVRRAEDRFESVLTGHYGPANVTPVPDEMDPIIPRLIFSSTHGFSQILASQVNIVFIVRYSEDWQVNLESRSAYVKEHAALMFALAETLGTKALFCSLNSEVQVPATVEDERTVALLSEKLLQPIVSRNVYDLALKTTTVVNDKFFSNLTVSNFRIWEAHQPQLRDIVPLPKTAATQWGISFVNDFNDRYSFNEKEGYSCTYEKAKELLHVAETHLHEKIHDLMGENA